MRNFERSALAILAAAGIACAPGTVRAGAPGETRVPLRERVAERLRERQWPDGLVVGAISTLPVIELRGAIPVGILTLDMPWWKALAFAVAGNMLPVPLILALLGPLSRFAMRYRAGRRFFEWLFARTRRKTAGIEKYETLGLAIFVAIPLPATGAWTGAIAAFLLGIRRRHALWSILLGVVVAGVIVTALTKLGWIGAMVAGGALLALAVGALWRALAREERIGAATKP